MVHSRAEKPDKNSLKNAGQVFITGQYLNNLYHLNYLKQSELESINRLALTNLIKIYFNFTYYLCITPFRLRIDGRDGFLVHTWKPQQVTLSFAFVGFI